MKDAMKGLAARGAAVTSMVTGMGILSMLLAEGSFADDVNTTATTDITGFATTVGEYGAAVLGVILVGAGIVLAVKYLRKAASHA